jgi:hypothetical protein
MGVWVSVLRPGKARQNSPEIVADIQREAFVVGQSELPDRFLAKPRRRAQPDRDTIRLSVVKGRQHSFF